MVRVLAKVERSESELTHRYDNTMTSYINAYVVNKL